MKNELLKNIISSKEEEIREKEKELKKFESSLEFAKTGNHLMRYSKDEIKASIAFTEEIIKCKQKEIKILKELCNKYKKEYNLEEYKMKLSELKKIILKQFGEKGWEELKRTISYEIYNSSEEEQLKAIKRSFSNFNYINNPTEEMQLEAIKARHYLIDYMCNPSDKVLRKVIERVENVYDVVSLFKHIENDLNEE